MHCLWCPAQTRSSGQALAEQRTPHTCDINPLADTYIHRAAAGSLGLRGTQAGNHLMCPAHTDVATQQLLPGPSSAEASHFCAGWADGTAGK